MSKYTKAGLNGRTLFACVLFVESTAVIAAGLWTRQLLASAIVLVPWVVWVCADNLLDVHKP